MIRLTGIALAAACLLGLAVALMPGLLSGGVGTQAEGKVASQPVAAPVKRTPEPVLPPAVEQVLHSGVLIVVSKASQQMYVFKDGEPWDSSPVSTGKRGHATPSGVFPILQKRVFHRSNIYSNAPMPFMQRLTWSGIAIHAGYVPGYPASHGCIRLPKTFARSLFGLTQASATTVVVTETRIKGHSQARTLALNTPMPRPKGTAQPAAPALAAAPRIEALPLVPVRPQQPVRGQTIQLAAAASPQEAEAHWAEMLANHPDLARLEKTVIPAVVGSRQVYRLRASAPDAHAVCAALKRSGQACFNVS